MDVAKESIILGERGVSTVAMNGLPSWKLNSLILFLQEVLLEVHRAVVEAEEEACRTCRPVEGAAEAAAAAASLL